MGIFFRRTVAVLSVLALPLIGTATAPAPALAASAPDPNATPFAMMASGFATRIHGGDIPVDSGQTAYANFAACTNRVGKDKSNEVAAVRLGDPAHPLVVIGAGHSRAWSERVGDTVSANSEHQIASIRLFDGAIVINGITSTATAFHDGTKFGSRATTSVLSVKVGGFPAAVPTADHPLVIPGLVTISIGEQKTTRGKNGAFAMATALKIDMPATRTHILVARSRAVIGGGVETGLFGGKATGVTATALGGAVTSGPNPWISLPCEGSNTWRVRSAATVNLPGLATVAGLETRMLGFQDAATNTAVGDSRAEVARIELLDGRLVIDALRAQAKVVLVDGEFVERNGSVTAQVTLDGNPITLADLPDIEIPGVASIETNVVTHPKPNHLKVIALRITLLDGSSLGSVIDIATAEIKVRPSGL